jgi:hypothetical protein
VSGGGHIYFVNTQKLGEDKLLTKRGDGRQHTIWETLSNTARAAHDRFYVVIDEAHRGMREGRSEEKAKTIMQRCLKGSDEHDLVQMPLVIGVSATPRRFEELLAGTMHTVHKVYVPVDKVRTFGLLKDRILIHFPEDAPGAEMSLMAEAANRWQLMEQRWAEYCTLEGEQTVWPILVVQVEDGTEGALTKTDLRATLSTIESAIGRWFREGEVVHTQAAVGTVIEDLKNVEDIPPSETGSSRELVTLKRREGLEEVFAAWNDLVTYRMDAVRKQSALRRLVGLARALAFDRIDEDALARVKNMVVERMGNEINRLRDGKPYDALAKRITEIGLKTLTLQHGSGVAEPGAEYVIGTAAADIDRQFDQAGRLFGNGLQMDYWRAHADRDAEDVKVEVIILAQDSDGMRSLEDFAETEFDRLYEERRREISGLREQRRGQYEKLRLARTTPKDIPWHLPEIIDFRRTTHAPTFERHLYLEDDGCFRADLGSWKRELIEKELTNSDVAGNPGHWRSPTGMAVQFVPCFLTWWSSGGTVKGGYLTFSNRTTQAETTTMPRRWDLRNLPKNIAGCSAGFS